MGRAIEPRRAQRRRVWAPDIGRNDLCRILYGPFSQCPNPPFVIYCFFFLVSCCFFLGGNSWESCTKGRRRARTEPPDACIWPVAVQTVPTALLELEGFHVFWIVSGHLCDIPIYLHYVIRGRTDGRKGGTTARWDDGMR
jgi:hypothetical protein